MSSSKKTGSGKAGPSKADKGKRKATAKTSNIEMKANVRDANGGKEIQVDGGWVPAVYLDDIRDRVLRDTNAQGSYDHPPAKGEAALDVTAFHEDHKSWGESRDQRPKILFEYKSIGRQDPDYEVGTWMDNGRVVLGPDALPIRDFRDIPKLCSSQMEGFRMEAISRLDSRIAISDFRARMMRDCLPGANTLSMRKTRFRNKGRCLAWDKRAGTDFYEVKLRKEMTDDMINRNSTEELEDLSSGKVEKLQLETAGKAPARSGQRALADDVRAQRLQAAKEKNRLKLEAEAKLKKESTEQPSPLSESPSRTATEVVSSKKRKTTTETELGETLHAYVDELFEVGRPSKQRRTHESPSGAPQVLNAKKRKRTAGEEDVSNDEEAVEGRTFKRGGHWNLLELLPSAFSPTSSGSSLPPPERGFPTPDMANTGRPTGPSQFQRVAAWEQDEQPGWREASPLHQGRELDLGGATRVIDDRIMRPISAIEQARVQHALSPTRRHFEFVTGHNAPETNSQENYLSQYAALQRQFSDVWSESGIEDPAPALAGLEMWSPGSLIWSQSTYLLLNTYGAEGGRLFDELENELRDGLGDWFNQRAPRADMVQAWSNLGGITHANAAVSEPSPDSELPSGLDPLAAFEPFAESQAAANFDPSAGIDPSLLSGPFSVDQSFVTSDAPTAFEPFAGFQPSDAFASSPVWNPSEGSAPMAAFETQTSSANAEPPNEASNHTAPVAVGTTVGVVSNPSANPEHAGHEEAGIEFEQFLNSVLAEPTRTASPAEPAYPDVEQPADRTFEDSFLNGPFGIQDSPVETPLFPAPQSPQTATLQSTPPEQMGRPEDLHTQGLASDLEMFYREPDFWLS